MKYFAAIMLVLLAAILAGLAVARIIGKRKALRRRARALTAAGVAAVLLLTAAGVFLMSDYPADAAVERCLEGTETVRVTRDRSGCFFDGPGEEALIVFYPGAKIEAEAYAPLALALAEKGADVVIPDFPFSLAILDPDRASDLPETARCRRIFLAGHSLGGTCAAMFCAEHPQAVSGLILLAAYPAGKLPADLPVVSVYGTEDGVLDRETYETARDNWSEVTREAVLPGGNHSQFGSYGLQRGDRTASIPPEEQVRQTVEAILPLLADKTARP